MNAQQAFVVICPQYASDPLASTFISMATARTSLTLYGVNYGLAVALRAAHMLTLSKQVPGESDDSISSKREGDLAISYHQKTSIAGGGDLGLTHYGEQLKGLTKEATVIMGVTGGNDVGRNDTPYPDVAVDE